MNENVFKISQINGSIVLSKDGKSIEVSKTLDDDIWFSTHEEETILEITMYTRNRSEWQTYIVFESLMKSIVGRFVLNGEDKRDWSMLPKDFVDLENKIIIWHSDSGTDNVLKLTYSERIITISIIKDSKAKSYYTNTVRIRTDGSSYEYYYQEFTKFFSELVQLESRLNEKSTEEPMVKKLVPPNNGGGSQ